MRYGSETYMGVKLSGRRKETLLRLICTSFLQQEFLKSIWFLSCLGHKSRSNGTNYNGNDCGNNKMRTMQQKDKQFLFSKWVHFNRSLFKLLGNERMWLLVYLKCFLSSYFFNNAKFLALWVKNYLVKKLNVLLSNPSLYTWQVFSQVPVPLQLENQLWVQSS